MNIKGCLKAERKLGAGCGFGAVVKGVEARSAYREAQE